MSSDMPTEMHLTAPPEVTTGMGIRCSPTEAFNAFADPAMTKQFWIVESSGSLTPEATVRWDMNDEGAQASLVVKRFEPGKRLVFEWGDETAMTTVDLTFSRWRGEGCYVEVNEAGFDGTADELAARVADSTGGFTMVLCSLKALLEHQIQLNAVTDRLPD